MINYLVTLVTILPLIHNSNDTFKDEWSTWSMCHQNVNGNMSVGLRMRERICNNSRNDCQNLKNPYLYQYEQCKVLFIFSFYIFDNNNSNLL
jgi:hypothetical protein